MGKAEDKFIENLSNFSDALENIVELLKEQQKISPTNVVNQLLDNIDGEKINLIVENLEEINKRTKTINTNTENILNEIKQIKSQKEKGMFGEIESPDAKNTILKGVKTIMLISGAVLAMGTAFNIIGHVDYLSVLSLGMSMLFISYAFSNIAAMKELSISNSIKTALIMSIMAGGVLSASMLLNEVPIIDSGKLLTAIGVGAAIGITSYFLLSQLDKMDIKKMWSNILTLPIMLPLISSGILASAFIINEMPTIDMASVISVALTGLALIPAAFAFSIIAKSLEKVNMGSIIGAATAMPLISLGIFLSSEILQWVSPMSPSKMIDILMTSIAVGVSSLALLPAIWLLNKSKLDFDDVFFGSLSTVIIAGAIAASSHLLSLGNYTNAPPIDWTLGAGLSLLLFTPAVMATGFMITSMGIGLGLAAIGLGSLAALLISGTIMATSHILNLGNYSKYPTVDWSAGVGLSLLSFGLPMMLMGTMILASFGLGAIALLAGAGAMLLVSETIVESSKILSRGVWSSYPSKDWAEGVAISLGAFVSTLSAISGIRTGFLGLNKGIDPDDFLDFIRLSSTALVESADIFNRANAAFNINNVPSKEWSEGVGLSLTAFSKTLSDLNEIDDDAIVLFRIMVRHLANALVDAALEFNKYGSGIFIDSNVPSKEWAEGVGISLTSFAQAIKALDEADVDIDADDLYNPDGAVAVMLGLSKGIIDVGKYFNEYGIQFDVSKVPPREWGENISDSLIGFANAIKAMDDADVDVDFNDLYKSDGAIAVMLGLSMGLIDVAKIFNKSNADGIKFDAANVPSGEWSKKISESIINFSDSIGNVDDIDEIIESMDKFTYSIIRTTKTFIDIDKKYSNIYSSGGIVDLISNKFNILSTVLPNIGKNADPIYKLADSLTYLTESLDNGLGSLLNELTYQLEGISKSMNSIDENKVNSLYSFGMGLQIMSLVEQDKLKKTLDVIEAKKNQITSVIDKNGVMANMFENYDINKTQKTTANIQDKIEKPGYFAEKDNIFKERLLGYVKNIDENINKIANPEEGEEELRGNNVNGGKILGIF